MDVVDLIEDHAYGCLCALCCFGGSRADPSLAAPPPEAVASIPTEVAPSAGASQRIKPSSVANALAAKLPAYGGGRQDLRDSLSIAMRAGSLCTMAITHGLPPATYTTLLGFVDSHFPGAVGDLNHSHHFVAKFTQSLLQALGDMHRQALSTDMPALRIPSDFFRAFDTLTPLNGEHTTTRA